MNLKFVKSSYSIATCVEVAAVPLRFVTSSFCAAGACIQTAALPTGGVAMRDSKLDDGPLLCISAADWDAFERGLREDQFDLADLTEEARKSFCSYDLGECVRVRRSPDGNVVVFDDAQPDGPELSFTPAEWIAFTADAKNGEFRRSVLSQ